MQDYKKDIVKGLLQLEIKEQEIFKELEEVMGNIKAKIKEKKFFGTPKTLTNDELAHNGALSLSIKIIDEEMKRHLSTDKSGTELPF